jgi:hypothetical protein
MKHCWNDESDGRKGERSGRNAGGHAIEFLPAKFQATRQK